MIDHKLRLAKDIEYRDLHNDTMSKQALIWLETAVHLALSALMNRSLQSSRCGCFPYASPDSQGARLAV
jgi:hypothetical protein